MRQPVAPEVAAAFILEIQTRGTTPTDYPEMTKWLDRGRRLSSAIDLWIDHYLMRWATKKDVNLIEYVASENALITGEVCLQPARILNSIQHDPQAEKQSRCNTRPNATH